MVRDIAQIGHPVLRQVSRPVDAAELATPAMQQLIDELIETMRAANGAGIAAPQIYEPVQICVVEVRPNNPRYPYRPAIPLTVLVNPELSWAPDAETFDNYEGCLSVPNLRGLVRRSAVLTYRALDRHGEVISGTARGLRACTYQHETDHLHGKLFVDRVTDPTTFCTWEHFDRFQKEGVAERVRALVARHGE